MSEVFFYHLTRSPLELTLKELLMKCRSRDWRVLVRGRDTKRMVWLDEKLWDGDDFFPHGFMTGAFDKEQPVLLTEAIENVNKADILLLIDGAKTTSDEIIKFKRVCLLFDGHDETALREARQDWKSLTAAGIPAQYWSQETGQWQQKMKTNVSR